MIEAFAASNFAALQAAIDSRKRLLLDYLMQPRFSRRFQPEHMRTAVYSTIRGGGKSLRPVVAMLACGALGGDEARALPVAAAIEITHTWTLVHDDIIDRDDTRRGQATVHREFAVRAADEFGWDAASAEHYGQCIALLAGDLQQSWAWSLLFDAHLEHGLPAGVVLQLAQVLASEITPLLVAGETLDVQFAGSALELTEARIVDMLWKKTGALYEFAGRAGAAVALEDARSDLPATVALSKFCSLCGTAFQIQDDILGIIGDAQQLGKPVGSDIREGKSTLLTFYAMRRASPSQRQFIGAVLGNAAASDADIAALIELIRELGAVEYAQRSAKRSVDDALQELWKLPRNPHRDLLEQWAQYMIQRVT